MTSLNPSLNAPLKTFVSPGTEWVDTPYGDVQLVGSGRTKFVFWVEIDEVKTQIHVYEKEILAWCVDDKYVTFDALGKLDNEYVLLRGRSHGESIDVVGRHDNCCVLDIQAKEDSNPLLTFSSLVEYEEIMLQRRQRVKFLTSKHHVCVGMDMLEDFEEFDSCSDVSDVSSQEEEEKEEEVSVVYEEVELEDQDWKKIAQNMWSEIKECATMRRLNDGIVEFIRLMSDAIDGQEWEEAIAHAATIRPLFRFCPYKPEVEDKVWRINRKFLKDDLSHIENWTQMTDLRLYMYERVHLVPLEVLGDHPGIAESADNVLFVHKDVYADMIAFHATLIELMDESEKNDLKDGKQLQLSVDTKRILKSSYIPNRIIYQVRGFRNFDKIVDVW
jgi:hypothetical protein